MSPKKRRPARVHQLRASEQASLLERLAMREDVVGEVVREEIERLVANVDPEEVAGDVQAVLELLDVDAIMDRAGEDRYGYTGPQEAAWEALEDALAPYRERLNWYHTAGRPELYDAYALGVLRGLYDFHHESDAEWTALAPDDAGEAFAWVLDEWKRRRRGTAERQAMRDQLAEHCPGWEQGLG
ncbi:MAG: hypothetical protein ACNA8N_08430 [Trueperaceae bacterium]